MPRPLCDSETIFGLHDPGGEQIMLDAGRPGWILFTEKIGCDPNDRGGKDFRPYSNRGLGVLVRLNNGYEPEGTIPASHRYEDFAQRCANYVAASQGCHIWIIGNEMNFVVERPSLSDTRSAQPAPAASSAGDESGDPPRSPRERPDRFNALHPGNQAEFDSRSVGAREVITPQLYARCYRRCRELIRQLPGHGDDQVLIGSVAPWNNQTQYPGNANGDWVQYFQDILKLLEPDQCDGITIHTYTHGDDPNLIYSKAKMEPPFADRHYHFYAYRDFMEAIPASMRHLPVYITETDQDVAWRNENRGWIKNAYAEINHWNQQEGNQQIRALILYRWPQHDKWYIKGKQGVISDFKEAMAHDYKWRETPLPARPPYKVAWLEGGGLRRADGGEVITTHFKLRNDGSKTWPNSGVNRVRLGYHWDAGEGKPILLAPDQDFRTELPRSVAPGETVELAQVRVAIPPQAGALRLRWDLVEEGVTWFKDQGSQEKVETVNVKAPPAPPDELTVPETGKTIRGPFLAWYREHGLDVTGYPVTDQFKDGETGLQTQYFQRIVMEEYAAGRIRLRLVGQDFLALRQRFDEAETLLARLQGRIADLERQLAARPGRIPRPEARDIAQELPRAAQGFLNRNAAAIRYLVIHHTGGPASVPAAQLAEYHIQRGYPGLAYHYLIGQDGVILQTNPWSDIVSDQGYLGQGIHIAFAGIFNDVIPNESQLNAAAQLCAWLLQELNLPATSIMGVGEFVTHGSPGWQWLQGRRYKEILLARVAQIQAEAGPPAPDDGDSAALRAEIAALQTSLQEQAKSLAAVHARLEQAQSEISFRDARISELEDEIGRLTTQLAAAYSEIERLRSLAADGTAGAGGRVPQPLIQDVVDQLLKHPVKTYPTRRRQAITHLCIHHSAVAGAIPLENIADYHVNSRDWPGIGYHFYVKPNGAIYQTNRMETISYHVSQNNDYTLGICLAGDFTYAVPTETQLDAAARLAAWLMQELDISEDKVMGHKEYPHNDTSCPGETWLKGRRWKDLLQQRVREIFAGAGRPAKALQHYLLFWQQPEAWAREDWLAAERYVGRFRPTSGFSLDDAMRAEYVTIVGGTAGVSYEAEQALRAAGCRVERLAGADFAETKRILDEMAEQGRRFRDFPG